MPRLNLGLLTFHPNQHHLFRVIHYRCLPADHRLQLTVHQSDFPLKPQHLLLNLQVWPLEHLRGVWSLMNPMKDKLTTAELAASPASRYEYTCVDSSKIFFQCWMLLLICNVWVLSTLHEVLHEGTRPKNNGRSLLL